MDQNPAISQNRPNGENPQQQSQQPQPSKKKPRQNWTLKAEHFQKQNGFQALYKAIEQTDFTRGQDNVDLSMKKIVALLKTWNFQMLPRYSFDYFLQRCRALGNHKFTQAYMAKVRKIHKGEDSWDSQKNIEQDAVDNANLQHLNPNAFEQPNELLHNQGQSTAQNKLEEARKLISQIEKREHQNQQFYVPQSRKMEIEKQKHHTAVNQNKKEQGMQPQQNDQDFDECEQLFRQMDALEQQKRELFGKTKKDNSTKQQEQKKQDKKAVVTPQNQDSQEIPYVPEGFEDVDFENESSYNNNQD